MKPLKAFFFKPWLLFALMMDLAVRSRCALRACTGLWSHQAQSCSTLTPAYRRAWQAGRTRLPACSRKLPVKVSRGLSMAAARASLTIELVPCLTDNYAYLLHDTATNKAAIVDPSEAGPVMRFVEKKGLELTHVLNTHHHWDHTGGNEELKKKYGLTVVGPKSDRERIPGIDVVLGEGDAWKFGEHEMVVFDTPGHTKGHVSYFFPGEKAVFTGDTLFALGCGRLFEGSPPQMWTSLSKLAALPDDTKVFCGHEYTESNAKFAMHVDAGNAALIQRTEEVRKLRSQNRPTIPSTMGEERATNPFLRPFSAEIRSFLKIAEGASDAEALGIIRKAKDSF